MNSAPWLLKQEMRRLDSLLMRAAQQARVPGGHALTVDREVFSRPKLRGRLKTIRGLKSSAKK